MIRIGPGGVQRFTKLRSGAQVVVNAQKTWLYPPDAQRGISSRPIGVCGHHGERPSIQSVFAFIEQAEHQVTAFNSGG